MITNVNMLRKMGNFEVVQRTKDGFFDANYLLRQWNKNADNPQRKMETFLDSVNTKEFVKALIEEINLGQNCPKIDNQEVNLSGFPDKIDNQVIKKSRVKEQGKAGRPVEQVWMHPYLFIKFAMWLNPAFEVKVIKFVYDEMIKYRNLAGDNYKRLSAAVDTLVQRWRLPSLMTDIAMAINMIVFNNHEKGIRNKYPDPALQQELSDLEIKVSELVEDGFITSEVQVITFLKKQYDRKNYPNIFKIN